METGADVPHGSEVPPNSASDDAKVSAYKAYLPPERWLSGLSPRETQAMVAGSKNHRTVSEGGRKISLGRQLLGGMTLLRKLCEREPARLNRT